MRRAARGNGAAQRPPRAAGRPLRGHQGAGRGPTRLLKRAADCRRSRSRQALQGRPLGAAENPADHTDEQVRMLRRLRNCRSGLARPDAQRGRPSDLRSDLDLDDVGALIDRFTSRASRSRLKPFIRLAKTIRKHRDGILAAMRLKINNARVKALNNKARLVTRRAYGFDSPAPLSRSSISLAARSRSRSLMRMLRNFTYDHPRRASFSPSAARASSDVRTDTWPNPRARRIPQPAD
jgi:Transposase